VTDLSSEPRIVRWLIADAAARPRRALIAWAAITAISLIGLGQLRLEISTESVLDRSGEEWRFYLESTEVFGSDEDIVVAIPAGMFPDDAAMQRLRNLASKLQRIAGVRRVDSLATTPLPYQLANGAAEFTPPFASPMSPDEAAARAKQVLASSSARGLLVSDDGRTLALRLRLDDPLKLDVQRLSAEIWAAIGSQPAWVSGVPIFRAETSRYTQREIQKFVPITVVVIGILLWLFFRSVAAVALALAVGSVGSILVLGVMGALGVSLSLTGAILPSVLIAIGCANVTHLLADVDPTARGLQLASSASEVARPIVMASVVTALAFLSGALVPIEAIRVIAAFGALGALVLALATIHLGTAVLESYPIPRIDHRTSQMAVAVSQRLVRLATHRSWSVVATWAALLTLAGIGARGVSLETDVTQWFPRRGEVRLAYDAISSRLAGISPLNIVVHAEDGSAITAPVVIDAIDRLTKHLEQLDDVGRAVGINSLIGDTHRVLMSAPANELPKDVALVEQYLLLLESSDELREFVSADRTLSSVSVRVNNNGSERLLAIADEAERWWAANGAPNTSARATGIMYEFARAEREITRGQISGLGLDCVALLFLYFILFRSVGVTLVALVPTVATVLSTFGLLGWAGASLDAGTVFVGTLAVGVTVDETVHLVTAYARSLKQGGDPASAVGASLHRMLPALLMTTSTLAGGFVVLGVSSFAFTRQLGVATAIAMVVCAAANATLLPTLLALRRPK
jgi:uncharacterized protein